ncbi:NAD(P)/FAD-dependent oxidoreductase [Kiloniella sp.]|uniref:NAD(P)/FAD-dependent oxidoreductase n=1 Tax=Kiloniella sp. TaxID=1938587 RepID=UPI003B01A029
MNKHADILVIGGGIAGISAAARMAPDAKVIVLEQEQALGYHSTGRSAAIFIRNYGNDVLRALNAASSDVLENPTGISDRSLLSIRGELLVATEKEVPEFETYLKGAVGIEELTPKEATELVPILRQDRLQRVAIERDAYDIDVDRLLQGYAKLLRSHGGETVMAAKAIEITKQDNYWNVKTPAGAFIAPIIVNAAGAWADEIAQLAGVTPVGLVPMRRSAAILPAPNGFDVTQWPLVVSASETWYFKPEAGKLMVSPAEEIPVEPHDAWVDDLVLAEGLNRFEKAVTIPVTRVERSWAGLRNFVKDRTPVVGFSPDPDGFFWLAGQGGYGVQTSPALSCLTADLMFGRKPQLSSEIVAALDPGRTSLTPKDNP